MKKPPVTVEVRKLAVTPARADTKILVLVTAVPLAEEKLRPPATTVPAKFKLQPVKTGIWLPVGFCEASKPPSVLALIAKPLAVIRWRGLRASNETPEQLLATCAATSTFK